MIVNPMAPIIETPTLAKINQLCERMLESSNTLPAREVYNCEACRDTGFEFTDKGARPCPHVLAARQERACAEQALRNAAVLTDLIPKYAKFRLEDLRPLSSGHENHHAKQAAVIAQLQHAPGLSYSICGTYGTGKTTMAHCLYRRALEDGRPAIATTLADLLASVRDQKSAPIITPETIRANRDRQFLLIDEFGKTGGRVTEFASGSLHSIVQACDEADAQIVITANKDVNELMAYWSTADAEYGPSIMRKLLQKSGSFLIEMF